MMHFDRALICKAQVEIIANSIRVINFRLPESLEMFAILTIRQSTSLLIYSKQFRRRKVQCYYCVVAVRLAYALSRFSAIVGSLTTR